MNYKLTSEFIVNAFGVKLFRIQCIKTFKHAKEGDLGGYIESEKNLSGNAWVSGNAEVSGNARVYGDAWVYGNAWVSGDAEVYGYARVYGDAWVYGNAWVYGDAEVSGNAWVSGDAEVYGYARVYGNAWVTRKVFTLNFVYFLTLTDNHIQYGCEQKTIKEWEDFLDSDEVIETPRNTEKFKLIEMSLRLAIEQHKQISK